MNENTWNPLTAECFDTVQMMIVMVTLGKSNQYVSVHFLTFVSSRDR